MAYSIFISLLCFCIFRHFCYSTFPEAQKRSIHLFHGIHLEEHPNLIFYTESLPLIVQLSGELHSTTSFPVQDTFYTHNQNFCLAPANTSDFPNCRRIRHIRNLTQHITEFLAHFQDNFNTELLDDTQDRRRALAFIGNFLSFCCEVATHEELFAQNIDIKTAYKEVNKLKNLVHQDHSELVETHKTLNNFTQHVKSSLKTFAKTLDEFTNNQDLFQASIIDDVSTKDLFLSMFETTTTQLYLTIYQQYLHQIHMQCNKHTLPSNLLSEKELLTHLQRFSKNLSTTDLELAIPLQDIRHYYDLPITSCYFAASYSLLHISIPVRPKNMICNLHTYSKIPMNWMDFTCYLDSTDFMIATCDSSYLYIPTSLNTCNPKNSPLCLLPRYHAQSQISTSCIQSILQNNPISTLKKLCPFVCNPKADFPVIFQPSPTHLFVTPGYSNLTLQCTRNASSMYTEVLQHDITGTYELHLPCHCQLLQQETVIIRRLHLCDLRAVKIPIISHLLPAMWTDFTSLRIDPLQPAFRPKFQNYSELIQSDWAYHMPPFAEKTIIDSDIFNDIEPHESWTDVLTSSTTWTTFFAIWCTILTFVVVYLYCITIRNLQYRIDLLNLQAISAPSVSVPLRSASFNSPAQLASLHL